MSSMIEMLTQTLGSGGLGQISKVLGADENKTSAAVSAALPTLLGALARNASQPDGAEALNSALAKDHDGSILDNLSGLIGDPSQGAGAGILKHVLGGRQTRVENSVSKSTGLDAGSVGKLMTMLAPMVMGALGKQQRERRMDARGLSDYLSTEQRTVETQAPKQMGAIGALLDTDGDGDVDMSDVAKHGMGLLGKLMGR